MSQARLERLRALFAAAEIDALWVSGPENIRYLSGFSDPRDARLLVTLDGTTLYTDARYTLQAAEESPLPAFIARTPQTYQHAAESLLGRQVGIEAGQLTVAEHGELGARLSGGTVATSGLVEGLRLVKEEQEIELIRAAQGLADAAFEALRPGIRAGAHEEELAAELEHFLRRRGAKAAFDFTVASGPRGALPHAGASRRTLAEDELVTLDFGAQREGYHSDMTRTVAVGSPSEELRRLYRAVLEAERAAVAAVRPGAICSDLDAAAREVLAGHGLGEYFAHSLGHGVGLAIHEGPGLRAGNEQPLQAGMVVTIEPGVYLPGVGGVRIEDLLLVTEGGHEVLSRSPTEEL